MRYVLFVFCLVTMLISGSWVWAADTIPKDESAKPKVAIKISAQPNEIRGYLVKVSVSGKDVPIPNIDKPVDLNAVYTLKIRHKYGARDSEGLTMVEVSVIEGEAVFKADDEEEKLIIRPDTYPKLTAMFDANWRLNNIYGIRETAGRVPGVNYENMIILFHLPGLDGEHSIGDTWESKTVIPASKESYSISSAIKGLDKVDGVPAVVVKQEIASIPSDGKTEMVSRLKADGETYYALDSGGLLKSQIASQVNYAAVNGRKPTTANIKIDIVSVR